MKVLLTTVILFLLNASYGQEMLAIRGIVQDSETRKPLDLVSIEIGNTGVFATSNDEGHFEFHYSRISTKDSVRFSHLGYTTTAKSIESLLNAENIILLKAKAILLPEVVISEDSQTRAKSIVAQAIKNIPINYASDDFILEGYWRMSQMVDDKYISYLDASIETYDSLFTAQPKKKRKPTEKISIKAVRGSDYLNPKPYAHMWDSAFAKRVNILGMLLRGNSIRTQRGVLLTKEVRYDLSGEVYFNDELCYVITIPKKGSFYEKNPLTHHERELIISKKDFKIYRIHEVEYGEKGNKKSYAFSRKVNNDVIAGNNGLTEDFEFKEYHGKLYLNYARIVWTIEDYNIKTNTLEHINFYNNEFYVNKIREDVTPNDKKAFMLDVSLNYTALKIPYKPQFWRTYNFVPFDKDVKKAFADLSVKTPIEQQFNNYTKK